MANIRGQKFSHRWGKYMIVIIVNDDIIEEIPLTVEYINRKIFAHRIGFIDKNCLSN